MFEIGKNGVALELNKDYRVIDKYIQIINQKKFEQIFISADEKSLVNSLRFMEQIKNPELISELGIFGSFTDISSIYRFNSVRKLKLDSGLLEKIDLSCFPNLLSISAESLKVFENLDKQNVTELCLEGTLDYERLQYFNKLIDLCVYQPKDIDLTRLTTLQNIEHIQFKQGNIRSLDGIEKFRNLKHLYLYNCRYLRSIKGIEQCKKLKTLYFESCGAIDDLEIIAKCNNIEAMGIPNYKKKRIEFVKNMACNQTLKCMDINNCVSISSLAFINDYPNLEALYFIDTNVLDGDMIPCLKLQTAATFTKRHYNIKDKDLPMQYGIRHWIPGA